MESFVSRAQLSWTFWSAALLSVGRPSVPFGEFVIYPFVLLSTWAHELGHGVTALLWGGEIKYLVLLTGPRLDTARIC